MTRRSACGRLRPARSCAVWKGIKERSLHLPYRPTAKSSPLVERTERLGCGTWPRARKSAGCRLPLSTPSPSHQTARPLPLRGEIWELWKVATGQKLFQLKGHEGWVDAVTFLPDGKALASGGGDKTIRIWDIGTGRTIGQLQGHQDVVESIAVSPDGKTLASTGSDNTVRLWDVGTGRELRQLQGPESRGTSVTFSSNGKIVAATELQMVRLWEVATGKPLRKLRSPLPMLHMSGAWSPDRKIFASGGTDGIICLWNLTTGQLMPPFLGTQGQVGAVAFSPDAKTIASAGSTAVTVWKATTGEPLHRIKGSSGQFFATFAPDGRTLITDGGEGSGSLPSGTAQRGSVFKPSTERLRGWMPWYFRQTVRS